MPCLKEKYRSQNFDMAFLQSKLHLEKTERIFFSQLNEKPIDKIILKKKQIEGTSCSKLVLKFHVLFNTYYYLQKNLLLVKLEIQ